MARPKSPAWRLESGLAVAAVYVLGALCAPTRFANAHQATFPSPPPDSTAEVDAGSSVSLHSSACHQAAEQVEAGKRRFAQRDYPGAVEEFRAAVQLCPQNPSATLELVRALLAGRRFPEAEQTARKFLIDHPRSEPGQYLLAYSLFMQGRYQETGKLLRRLLDQNDHNPDAHKLMGLTLFFYKEYVLAEYELATALRSNPRDEEALYFLGRVYYAQNNFPPAVEAFEGLVGMNPRSYKGYDNLGLCYEAQGKTEEASAAFRRAQALARDTDPAYDWPYANLAELLIKENRAREALPYAQDAARINPQSARNQFLLGKALSRVADLDSSIGHLRRAVELDADYPDPHYLLGQLYQKQGRRSEAEHEFALFEEISKRTPHKRR